MLSNVTKSSCGSAGLRTQNCNLNLKDRLTCMSDMKEIFNDVPVENVTTTLDNIYKNELIVSKNKPNYFFNGQFDILYDFQFVHWLDQNVRNFDPTIEVSDILNDRVLVTMMYPLFENFKNSQMHHEAAKNEDDEITCSGMTESDTN